MRAARHGKIALTSDRVDRVLFLLTGLGGLVYLALAFGSALDQEKALRGGASWVIFGALSVGCLLLTSCATLIPLTWLHRLATAVVVAYSIALASWIPLQQTTGLPHADTPWLLGVVAISTTCAFLAFPVRAAAAYLIIICIGGGVVRGTADSRVTAMEALQDTLFMLLICTLFAALLTVFVRASRAGDAAMAAAYRDAQEHGASQARAKQRDRFGALVHDDVISALLVASQGDDSRRDSMRIFAMRALKRIDAAGEEAPDEAVPPSECAARLRAASHVPGAPALTVEVATTRAVPTVVVEALGEALGEALRNSLRHAPLPDRPVFRSAEAKLDDAGVRVRVHDDGAGFVVSRVPPERLGLRASVIGRMNSVEGGRAVITSRPREGTTVELVWMRGPVEQAQGDEWQVESESNELRS